MLILDTDHMSLLEWGGEDSSRLRENLADQDPNEVFTTIISYEEQMRGWMAYIARARSVTQQIESYRRLRNQLENYRQISVLDFEESAGKIYQELKHARIRIGGMDLKIAAVALAHNAILLTRNLRDFSQVPRLKAEDWTR